MQYNVLLIICQWDDIIVIDVHIGLNIYIYIHTDEKVSNCE